ncbi:hypothetical protein ISN44_As02g004750 [Arabidopsis suecica]|uniref:Uncharacterized protein n=1 Tax=Arabidopsis suecica TaxID=45249 RepID=A0A8T2FZE1_ARASU|nr:hypothetical protein ISN44_As02g004750 [Arabidopsis suecica]
MNYSQLQPSITIPQNTTSVEDFCNDGMACLSLSELNARNTFPMYEASIHPTQGNLQCNDNQSYNMAQGFINPYMPIESQSMPHKSQQQLQLNNDCVNHDSYYNATVLSAMVPPTIDSLHQDTLNNTILLPTTPQAIPESLSHNTYMSSYPSHNTLEVVKAQLNALQDSSTSQTQETFSRETNLSSLVTRDEVHPVDKYIDWDKVEENDIELDPVEVLDALDSIKDTIPTKPQNRLSSESFERVREPCSALLERKLRIATAYKSNVDKLIKSLLDLCFCTS